MKVRIEQIGSSRVIRLPQTLLPEAQIGDVVDLHIEPYRRHPPKAVRPRNGWMEAARHMRTHGEDRLLNAYVPTRFDREDWKWE